MEKKATIIPENIHLLRLDIVEKNIKSIETKSKSINFKLNVAHTTMHNLKEEKIKIGLLINIIPEVNKKETGAKANFNIDFHYQIKDLNSFYSLDDKNNPIFSVISEFHIEWHKYIVCQPRGQ